MMYHEPNKAVCAILAALFTLAALMVMRGCM